MTMWSWFQLKRQSNAIEWKNPTHMSKTGRTIWIERWNYSYFTSNIWKINEIVNQLIMDCCLLILNSLLRVDSKLTVYIMSSQALCFGDRNGSGGFSRGASIWMNEWINQSTVQFLPSHRVHTHPLRIGINRNQ